MRTTNHRMVLAWVLIWALHACSGQNDSVAGDAASSDGAVIGNKKEPQLSFLKLTHDFGTIIEGERVVCYFDYQNAGGSELVINSVQATCGCTTPDWSREPLSPGDTASLTIIFDASGRSGAQRKVITVDSNALNSPVRLTVKANVEV